MMQSNKTRSQALNEALKQPNGARFYRCALQVNPFAYHGRHGKKSVFSNEADYNAAIIAACRTNNIEAIAVTDHYRISDSMGLISAAREAGIFVFGGFEAASDDGVHFLCLYDPDKDSNLNVLVGGRGTGKSTVVESLRYALAIDPIGEEATKAHQGVLKHVLKSGTKVSLLVRSHHPAKRDYTIERTIPNPAVVKDEFGDVLNLAPRDVVPGVEVFGQHEISELTKSREKLTLLLERFVERDPNAGAQKAKLRLELERSRSRIADVQREMKLIEERLGLLPSLEETQKRFQDAGLEERLKEKSLLVREERILTTIKERLIPVSTLRQELAALLPIDTAFLSVKALEGLPNSAMLIEGAAILDHVTVQLQVIAGQIEQSISAAEAKLAALRARWDERRQAVETTYQALLRELQKSKIDGEEFIRLRRQIEELRPLREKKEALTRDLTTYQANRRNLLDEWFNLQSAEYRALEKAAKRVSRKLTGRVRAMVTMGGNREPLERLLREEIGGNLAALLSRLESRDSLSLLDFAQRCREGKDSLVSNYNLPLAAAERLAQATPDIFMRLEELELPATTKVELNTSSEGGPETWQTIEALSTGQKATAVLLLLLLESEAPLVVDQPEDDLDNRFITEGVVPTMKDEKRKRQFVFSTHNANIPVLGDAELIVGLSTGIQNEAVQGRIDERHVGSIDMQPVREMVEEILEGGKTAFEMRRQKYGF